MCSMPTRRHLPCPPRPRFTPVTPITFAFTPSFHHPHHTLAFMCIRTHLGLTTTMPTTPHPVARTLPHRLLPVVTGRFAVEGNLEVNNRNHNPSPVSTTATGGSRLSCFWLYNRTSKVYLSYLHSFSRGCYTWSFG